MIRQYDKRNLQQPRAEKLLDNFELLGANRGEFLQRLLNSRSVHISFPTDQAKGCICNVQLLNRYLRRITRSDSATRDQKSTMREKQRRPRAPRMIFVDPNCGIIESLRRITFVQKKKM